MPMVHFVGIVTRIGILLVKPRFRMSFKSKKMGTIHKSQPRFWSRPTASLSRLLSLARYTQIMFSDAMGQAS